MNLRLSWVTQQDTASKKKEEEKERPSSKQNKTKRKQAKQKPEMYLSGRAFIYLAQNAQGFRLQFPLTPREKQNRTEQINKNCRIVTTSELRTQATQEALRA